jgi:hypothetical protein
MASAVLGKRFQMKKSRTESLLGLHNDNGELAADGNFLEQLGNLKVARASQVLAIDNLNMISNSHLADAGLRA